MSEKPGKYQRSTGGLIGAMLVLLVVVAAFVAFRALVREEPEVEVKTVDYEQAAGYAQTQVDFPLLVPDPLPEGWRATSVDFVPEPGRWNLGVLTDEDRYVGLAQAERTVENMVETYVDPEAEPGEAVEVAGTRWDSWTDADGDTALTRDLDGVVVLVVSPAGLDAITEFVESLSVPVA